MTSYGIQILYPVLGAVAGAIAVALFVCYIYTSHSTKLHQELEKQELLKKEPQEDKVSREGWTKIIFMVLMMPFIFFYVGMENAFGTFVATFSVKSRLGMSNQDGAVVAAIFWGSFATSRCVVIFLSLKLKSLHLLVICQLACLVGAIGLVLYGDTSVTVLQTCSGHIFILSAILCIL